MKITKYPRVRSDFEQNREKANIGCDVCPCCGEKRHFYYDQQEKRQKGTGPIMHRSFTHGDFPNIKSMRVDCYVCVTCGAQWESDPYEWYY